MLDQLLLQGLGFGFSLGQCSAVERASHVLRILEVGVVPLRVRRSRAAHAATRNVWRHRFAEPLARRTDEVLLRAGVMSSGSGAGGRGIHSQIGFLR